MIAFASMFLGLVLGIQPVSLVVSEDVSAVELLLNGHLVATARGPEWTAECDFGDELLPSTLEAVAFDSEGNEVSRARQRINLPGPLAQAKIVIEEGEDGTGAVARVVFDSVLRSRPVRAVVSLDGTPLEVSSPERFELPPFDPEQIHLLHVELEFPDNVTTTVETTFGGAFTGQVSTPQTAVPVVVRRGRAPRPEELSGSFLKNGAPLRVLAVDDGPAEVVIVRDLSSQDDLDRLAGDFRDQIRQRWRRNSDSLSTVSLRFVARLKKDQLVWLLEPFAREPIQGDYRLTAFPFSPHLTHRDGGLPFLLTTIRPPSEPMESQRLADAVAVAGRGVAQRDRRRAVVLILGAEAQDSSALSAEVVRRYLETLRVPLVVWSTVKPSEERLARWGEVRDVSNATYLGRSIKSLSQLLDDQSIVWVEGFHLPQQIVLSADGRSLEFPM
jgi:hypothetical protein